MEPQTRGESVRIQWNWNNNIQMGPQGNNDNQMEPKWLLGEAVTIKWSLRKKIGDDQMEPWNNSNQKELHGPLTPWSVTTK